LLPHFERALRNRVAGFDGFLQPLKRKVPQGFILFVAQNGNQG
jgi:hypothetical protein